MAREPHDNEQRERESFTHWLKQFPRAHNWLLLGLIVITIIGVAGALITQWAADEPSKELPVPETAVAGQRPNEQLVVVNDGGFDPSQVTLPQNGTILFRNEGTKQCQLLVDDSGLYELDPGEQKPWAPARPGQYVFRCSAGPPGELRVEAP